jgi:hypothetical protein
LPNLHRKDKDATKPSAAPETHIFTSSGRALQHDSLDDATQATLYSIVNVIGQDLTPKPSKFEESLLENFLPFPQEPKLIFAELAETIFIPHRMDNKLGHVSRGM